MIKLRNLFTVFLSLTIIVDMLNGYFINAYNVGVLSQLYKLIVVFICLFILAIRRPSKFFLYTSSIFLLVFGGVVFYSFIGWNGFIGDTLQIAVRCMMFFILYATIETLNPDKKLVGRLCFFMIIVLSVNFLLGYLGYGYSSYGNVELSSGDALGVKGYFYSGNEVSYLIMIFALFSACYFKSSVISILMIMLLLFCAVLLSTKTAILSVLIIFLTYVYSKQKKYIRYLGALVFVIGLFFLAESIISDLSSSEQFKRLAWMYETGGLTRVILSDRDIFLMETIQEASKSDYPVGFVIGFGRDYFDAIGLKSSVEMDVIDMYFWFGISGVIFFICYFLKLKEMISHANDGVKNKILMSFFTMSIVVSFIAGHVVYSGIAVIPLCMVMYSLKKEC